MHRFYLPPEQCAGSILTLADREAHHGLHVLRLRIGDRAIVLDGVGHEIMCEVKELKRDAFQLIVTQKSSTPALPYQVTLLQAIPKGKSFETIVQKATELGVSQIVPLLSERVVTHLDEDRTEHKIEKWQQVAIEAIKQCGSAWLPRIETPVTPKDFLARLEKYDMSLVASLQDDRVHPREWFRKFHEENHKLPQSVCVWIGPEGDFTPAELNVIKGSGALPISLGRLVLRSETAAVYCLSVLNYELQADWN